MTMDARPRDYQQSCTNYNLNKIEWLNNIMNISERFEAVEGEFLKFDRVKNKLNERPDLHAFILFDSLFPRPGVDMVTEANRDEIWLDVQTNEVEKLTNEQILELVRCGVRYDSESDSLAMYT